LRPALKEFTWFYNEMRVHQNLNGLTPMEAWQGKTLAEVQTSACHASGPVGQRLGWFDGGLLCAMLMSRKSANRIKRHLSTLGGDELT
jgi:hypothetical protein